MWKVILESDNYTTFEDPVTGFNTPKKEYFNIYGRALDDIFSYGYELSMIFTENPIIQGQWLFTDNDAQLDLYDISVELGLINTLTEIQAGETQEEVSKRRNTQVENEDNTYQIRFNKLTNQLASGKLSKKKLKKINREIRWLEHKIG